MECTVSVSIVLLFTGLIINYDIKNNISLPKYQRADDINQSRNSIDYIVSSNNGTSHDHPPPSYFDLWHVSLGSLLRSTTTLCFKFKYIPAISMLLQNRSMMEHVSGSKSKLYLVYICLLIILHSGDTEVNPGPTPSVSNQDHTEPMFPCAICHQSCTWEDPAVQCDECDEWYHANCMNMNTLVYEALGNSKVSWLCCNCHMPNFSSTFSTGDQIDLSNSFSSLASVDADPLSPLAASSPYPHNRGPIGSVSSTSSGKDRNVRSRTKQKTLQRNHLKIVVINFQGIRSKKDELHAFLDIHQPDVVIGTETHVNETILDNEIFPQHYNLIRKDRTLNGGGVVIAFKGDLVVSHRPDLDTEAEVIWAQLELIGSKPLLIGAFYRPQVTTLPEFEYLAKLRQSLDKINHTKTHQIWLGGDFNLPGIHWPTQSSIPGGYKPGLSKELLSIMNDFSLEQMVTSPTRQGSILDLFFTTNTSLVEKSIVLPGMSDHDGIPNIVLSTKPRKTKCQPRKIFVYKRADSDRMKEDLATLSSQISREFNDTNCTAEDLWQTLKGGILNSMEKNIPSKMITNNNSSPWMTQEIKRAHKRKQRAFNRFKKSGDPVDEENFRKIRKEINNQTRKTRRRYVRRTCESSSKGFWGFIKSLKQESFGICTLKDKGDLVSDNTQKAEVLNEQFRKVFTKEDLTSLPKIDGEPFPSMPEIIVTTPGVVKLLSNLQPKKAAGPDTIPARVLRDYAEEIAPGLTCVFQQSLDSGSLPEDWRQANISPVFKKGDRTKASNYRPVSLTSICCKTLEHIVHASIMDHLDYHHILCEEQHGFRCKHSCESQLIQTIHDLSKALDNKQETDVIIMDFSKAFDKVAHQRLLHKIDHYGIRGNVHNWITSFLTERKQRVVIGGNCSSWVNVESGVPQGTVLGPLLFLLFINDLPNNIRSTVRLFADDCVLYNTVSKPSDAQQLQRDLDQLRQWEKLWQMEFNAAKCFVMKITHATKIQPYSYFLGESKLEETTSHSYLGVEIRNDLKWNHHINKVTAAANRSLGFLRRNISSCSRNTKAKAFNSLVRPHLEYSASIWDPYSHDLITQLDKVQRRGARFVYNDYNYTSSPTKLLNILQWDSLALRRKERRI